MNIPKYARYDYCYKKSCEFLEQYNISSYPVEPLDIIRHEDYGLLPYSSLMQEYNCSLTTVCCCMLSIDGLTIWEDGNYSIAYNDLAGSSERIRFTLMHELGHIYLHHLLDFEKTTLLRTTDISSYENRVLENEANAFARNVLAPVSMVLRLNDKVPENVSTKFGITYKAAKTRLDLLQIDCQHVDELGLMGRMRNIFNNFYNKTECTNCHAAFPKRYRTYCPICGCTNTLKWGDGRMEYTEYKTNNEGFLEKCIRCDNQKLIGNFCHICGAPVKNFCSNYYDAEDDYHTCRHSEPLLGNARFCPDCGSKSTFYQNGILVDWNIEHDKYMQKEEFESRTPVKDVKNSSNGFMSIPDEIDEELPFN